MKSGAGLSSRPDGHTELDITVPAGSGTVRVVAVADGEKSNDVEFTYV